MKVVIVDTLGAIAAFRPKQIEFLREVYDKIPDAQKDSLESVLNKCKEGYDQQVAEDKKNGVRPSPAAIKTKVFGEILYPWLDSMNVPHGTLARSSGETKTVKAKNPRIPKEVKEEPTVQISIDEVSKLYDNNFPADLMEDSAPTHNEPLEGENESLFDGDYFDDAVVDIEKEEDKGLFEDEDFSGGFDFGMEEELL